MNIKNKATWELKQIVKALGTYELLNTEEENKRLDEARKELNLIKVFTFCLFFEIILLLLNK